MKIDSARKFTLLLAAALLLGAGCGNAADAAGTTDKSRTATSIFKRSHIPIWCDAPDGCPQYDVDVLVQDFDIVDEADVPKWRTFVEQRHAEGKLVCAEMRPLTHINNMLEFAMNDAAMQEAVCRDLDLQPIPVGWMKEHPYKGRVPPFYCSNHPHYREFLRQQIRFFMQIGADAVMVDDGGGNPFVLRHGGCFCEYCVRGFRDFLTGRYSPAQLHEQGVDDIETFDYREFVLKRAGDLESYKKQVRQGAVPFSNDFQSFLRVSDVELFRELQALASQLGGQHIPMGWDNVDAGGQYAPYYPFWDVFYSEITYLNFHEKAPGPGNVLPLGLVCLNKLADALGKFYMPTPGPRGWQAIMEGNFTGLLNQWTAFTYANGGAMRIPRKGWVMSEATPWYFPAKEDFEPTYDFIRRHRELFDDYEAVEQVGVLFTQARSSFAASYYTPLKRVCADLVRANVPFGFAVAGDDQLANRLRGDEAARFELMLIPEPIRLVDGQQAIVDRWKSEGRAVAVGTGDDVGALLGKRIEPLVSLRSKSDVWLFPRQKTGDARAPLVCHVLGADYDSATNRIRPQSNVTVRIRAALLGREPVRKVTYHTLGAAPLEIVPQIDAGGLVATIPVVDFWGILAVER